MALKILTETVEKVVNRRLWDKFFSPHQMPRSQLYGADDCASRSRLLSRLGLYSAGAAPSRYRSRDVSELSLAAHKCEGMTL